MTRAFGYPTRSSLEIASIVIDAARCWRRARDGGLPTQPILSAEIEACRSEPFAPMLDGLLTMFEAASGRRFEAGGDAGNALSRDECRLLDLVDDDGLVDWARPALALTMRIAARSARIMLSPVRPASDEAPSSADSPLIFFVEHDPGAVQQPKLAAYGPNPDYAPPAQ